MAPALRPFYGEAQPRLSPAPRLAGVRLAPLPRERVANGCRGRSGLGGGGSPRPPPALPGPAPARARTSRPPSRAALAGSLGAAEVEGGGRRSPAGSRSAGPSATTAGARRPSAPPGAARWLGCWPVPLGPENAEKVRILDVGPYGSVEPLTERPHSSVPQPPFPQEKGVGKNGPRRFSAPLLCPRCPFTMVGSKATNHPGARIPGIAHPLTHRRAATAPNALSAAPGIA
jgi:hypothetical protein